MTFRFITRIYTYTRTNVTYKAYYILLLSFVLFGCKNKAVKGDNSSLNRFEKHINSLHDENKLVYYKDFQFTNVEEAKRKLIFNKLSQLDISGLLENQKFESSPFSYSDIFLEEYLLDTLNLSNEELQEGIKKVLKKMETSSPLHGIKMIYQNRTMELNNYKVSISYLPYFIDSFFILDTRILISNDTDKYIYVTETHETNKTRNMQFERVESPISSPSTSHPFKSHLPFSDFVGKPDRYQVINSSWIKDYFIYPGYSNNLIYYLFNKETSYKTNVISEKIEYKEFKLTGNENEDSWKSILSNSQMNISNPRFSTNYEHSILLIYLSILFEQLKMNYSK